MDYDDELKASFFAVYDGHGGAEVAIYCSEKLPSFLKSLDKFKDKNFHQALINAFIGLDGDILKDETMNALKNIAGEKNPPALPEVEDEDDDEDDDEEIGDDENLAELFQEGRLPLNEVLLKYGRPKNKNIEKVEAAGDPCTPGGSGLNKKAKPLSPFLRAKREAAGEISSSVGSSSSNAGSGSSSMASPSDDSAVSSSSQAPGPSPKKSVENGSAEAVPKSNEPIETEDSCSPDSSAEKKPNAAQSKENQSDVSSSCSLNRENGEDSGVPSSAAESAENVDSNVDHDESSESEDDDFNGKIFV